MKEEARKEALDFTLLLAEKLHMQGMKTRIIEQQIGIANGTLSKNTER